MAEIKLVKLITGEEVLTKYDEGNPQCVLNNPVKLQLSQKGVAMIPLSPFMKENAKIVINKSSVLYTVDPDEDVVNAYNQQFGGIMIAPVGLSLG
jgi:hypothetical protein